MRIVNKTNEKLISLEEVNLNEMIVVVKRLGDWCLVTQREFNDNITDDTNLVFADTDNFTTNNCYDCFDGPITKESILKCEEAHAFNTFKEACEFLITVL